MIESIIYLVLFFKMIMIWKWLYWILIDCQWSPITSNDWTVIDYPALVELMLWLAVELAEVIGLNAIVGDDATFDSSCFVPGSLWGKTPSVRNSPSILSSSMKLRFMDDDFRNRIISLFLRGVCGFSISGCCCCDCKSCCCCCCLFLLFLAEDEGRLKLDSSIKSWDLILLFLLEFNPIVT